MVRHKILCLSNFLKLQRILTVGVPIHPFSILLILQMIAVSLEDIHGNTGQKTGDTLDGLPTHIAGHNWTPINIVWKIRKCQSAYKTCLWTEGGNQSTRSNPPKHGENMQTPCTHGRGRIQTPNPGGVGQMCRTLSTRAPCRGDIFQIYVLQNNFLLTFLIHVLCLKRICVKMTTAYNAPIWLSKWHACWFFSIL